MSIQDMIKKSVLEAENFSNAIGIELFLNIVINMLVSVLIGYLIYRLYRKYYNGVIYSRGYTDVASAVTAKSTSYGTYSSDSYTDASNLGYRLILTTN